MILGLDPGERRIGVAVADTETRFARPLEVIDVKQTDPLARIGELVEELEVECVVVGRPVALSGVDGPASEAMMSFLVALRSVLDVRVDVYDERMTTVIAERQLRASGANAATRKELRDAVAAQVMLQGYLDSRA